MAALGSYTSRLLDVVMEQLVFDQQRAGRPPQHPDESALGEPVGDLEERGDYEGRVAESSAYTRAAQGRSSTRRILGAGVLAAGAYGLYRLLPGGR